MYGALEEGDMTSGGDSPTLPVFPMGGAVGVTRSRTLPSSRRRGGPDPGGNGSNPNVNVTDSAPDKARERSRLSKKQKRSSMAAPQSHTHSQSRTSQIISSGHLPQGSA